jgi:hypothetical protein
MVSWVGVGLAVGVGEFGELIGLLLSGHVHVECEQTRVFNLLVGDWVLHIGII